MSIDSVPDEILQNILSRIDDPRDVACCNCVSKRWNDSTRYTKSLCFPLRLFNKIDCDLDNIVTTMVSRMVCLEDLVVHSHIFSSLGIKSWLKHVPPSIRHFEIKFGNRICNLSGFIHKFYETDVLSKLMSLDKAAGKKNLKSLKLWGVSMMKIMPKWGSSLLPNLDNLELMDGVISDSALAMVLQSCFRLASFSLVGCGGLTSIFIDLPFLKQCRLVFHSSRDRSLVLTSPIIESLEVSGCNRIRVSETKYLRKLSISDFAGSADMIDLGNLPALKFLSISGRWDAICKLLKSATEVKHLVVEVEFSENFEALQPFPELDFVEFFNSHKKLRKFDIDETMFRALCQKKNSFENVDSGFEIPFLKEVVINVRSLLDAQQKMSALESLLKHAKCLRTMIIKISVIAVVDYNGHTDDFFYKIFEFENKNNNIVQLESTI